MSTRDSAHRYWDGTAWTAHVAPAVPIPAPKAKYVLVAGKMTIGNAVLLSALVPLYGLVVGCIELGRSHVGPGMLLLLVSVVSLVVWLAVLGSI